MTDREDDFDRTAKDSEGRKVQQELERQLRELGDTMSDSFRHGFEGRGEEIGDRVWDVGPRRGERRRLWHLGGRPGLSGRKTGVPEAGRGGQKQRRRSGDRLGAQFACEEAGTDGHREYPHQRQKAPTAQASPCWRPASPSPSSSASRPSPASGTAGAFTSGGVMVAADMTVLSAIGDFALGAIAVTGWCSAAVTAVFGWLTAAGASRMKAAKTLELYADTAEGFDWHKGLSLSMLADLTHKKKTKALKMLRKFIHKGWLSAWLDEKNDKLYLTAEDYRAAQEDQPQPEPEKAPEQAGEVPLNLETTRRFAQVLEKEQELMEDERAVEELQHMQKTTESICAWLEAHPESLPKARRFAEYYIPTTLKLLHTYNDVQSQQGENAEAIRRDIAGILHTLNQAYDNLYDKLLSDVALDVSSEIAALQGMLANDGLAGEGLR